MSLRDLSKQIQEAGGFLNEAQEEGQSEQLKVAEDEHRASRKARKPGQELLKQVKPSAMLTFLECLKNEDIQKAVQVHLDAMGANLETYDLATKSWRVSPDHKTRMNAGAFIIANKEGLPLQKQQVLSVSLSGGMEEVMAKLQGSPAAAAFVQMLQTQTHPTQENAAEEKP